jgi:hypothetical protein
MPEPNSVGPPWTPALPGILDVREMYRGRTGSAEVSGLPTYQRVFLVRTTVVNPSINSAVALAPGPMWRDPYPGDDNARLVDMNVTQDGDSPYHYKVTLTYRFLDESDVIPWLRPSQFSFSGSLTSAPAFWYYKNANDNQTKEIIVNSAGDPLTGLDRDEGEFNVTIQYNQKPPFLYGRAQDYVGAINSDTWSGGEPKTWKCQSISAVRKFEMVPGPTPVTPPVRVFYFDTTITIAYRRDGWDLQTWNVGFNEIKGGKREKVLAGSGPVSEPVALNPNGSAKAPGQPPDMLMFRIYPTLPFNGIFEPIPDQTPSGYPYNL